MHLIYDFSILDVYSNISTLFSRLCPKKPPQKTASEPNVVSFNFAAILHCLVISFSHISCCGPVSSASLVSLTISFSFIYLKEILLFLLTCSAIFFDCQFWHSYNCSTFSQAQHFPSLFQACSLSFFSSKQVKTFHKTSILQLLLLEKKNISYPGGQVWCNGWDINKMVSVYGFTSQTLLGQNPE